ncbi:uncharacterized protein LOC110028852 [Phalaenopsis equestris]|uniref:uncharacterized protein LOC110028852 n=1 Tax=Phalaenopsis equestris TaxID=78828 RepID=UPI0009E26979|nr:uncharacterized protein LOC110028852 [Phalaenopsis equestris]XP_020586529.1 uncharacterized protein LOC110028852 [Phalaenopsis equestris]XP_020586530.1 uncharacterized protein LOC110028852 [Phalaenopsis equestris]
MGSKPAAAQRSPELKPENPRIPPVQQKEVLLFEWWLMKAERDYNGRRLTVGGFTKRGEAVGIFRSAPIIKRHDHCTLETADGINIKIQGTINKTRTIDNGFPLEACNAFLFGFPTAWDKFTEESSGNKSSNWRNLEHQPKNIFDPSFQQKTVLLRNWWLRKAEKGSDGIRLAVGGFTECGKAMRLFDSSPITKRHDAYTLETSDGITIRIEGFINKKRTLDNGFPLEACKTFLIGFPTTWTDFANGSSCEKLSHADIPVSASMGAEWSKDLLGLPVKSENTILNNDPSTSLRDSDTGFLNAIRRFTAWLSIYNNILLQDNESCGANMRDVHTEGAGCLKDDLHVGAPAQEESLNHEKRDVIKDAASTICKKYNGNAKVRPGLPKVENFQVEEQNNAKFRAKPVRRSPRLKSLNSKNACGEFQDNSMFFSGTNDVNCANLVPEGSKTCTISHPTDTLAEGCSSSPIICVEAQKLVKSLAKPVRKSETNNTNNANLSTDGPETHAVSSESPLSQTSSSILLPSVRLFSEENQDGHQHSINMGLGITQTSNSTSKYGFCDDSASTACLGQNLNDKKNLFSDGLAGLVEVTPANSKVIITSQTTEKRILRCSRTKNDDQTTRSRMKVEQNGSRNQSSCTSFKEKAKNVEVSTVTEQAADKASHNMRFRTVWVSSYKDFHGTPITRSKEKKSTITTPDSSNLKRSRSGRVLIPRLDCSIRAVYEPDGSFFGTAAVGGSCGGTAGSLISTSPSKGSGKSLHRKKRKRQP